MPAEQRLQLPPAQESPVIDGIRPNKKCCRIVIFLQNPHRIFELIGPAIIERNDDRLRRQRLARCKIGFEIVETNDVVAGTIQVGELGIESFGG